jgi:alkylation response protein AidB-like acyl-CoA dehydrogenase
MSAHLCLTAWNEPIGDADLGHHDRAAGTAAGRGHGEPGTFAWSEHLLGALGYRIAGGTEEIQRNIIAERVLGLPREPRPPAAAP